MVFSKEIGWLDIGVDQDTFTLLDHGRLERVVAEMANPAIQYPALCAFLGGRWKNTSLRHLYPRNNIKRRDSEAAVRLRYDMRTWGSSQPTLIVDGGLDFKSYPHSRAEDHIQKERSITWGKLADSTVLHAIWARLVFLFTDVVCIFADDFPGLSDVANFLASCSGLGPASSMPGAVRPRVIIVLGNVSNGGLDNVQQAEVLHQGLRDNSSGPFSESFSAIHLIHLEDDLLSETARHERLRALITGQLDDMHLIKQDHGVMINATQLVALFRSAFRHFADEVRQPFDIVKAARTYNVVPPSLAVHLAHYQQVGMQSGLLYEELVPSIASALVMDHYVPGMLSTYKSPDQFKEQG